MHPSSIFSQNRAHADHNVNPYPGTSTFIQVLPPCCLSVSMCKPRLLGCSIISEKSTATYIMSRIWNCFLYFVNHFYRWPKYMDDVINDVLPCDWTEFKLLSKTRHYWRTCCVCDLCHTMACVHVISMSLISDGDFSRVYPEITTLIFHDSLWHHSLWHC